MNAVNIYIITGASKGIGKAIAEELLKDGNNQVVGVQRTNLIDFAGATADGGFPLGVVIEPGSSGPVVVDVPLVPFRCDPHAVQEDKRGTIFAVRVEVAGELGDIDVFVGDELRGRILSWVVDWCGYGG